MVDKVTYLGDTVPVPFHFFLDVYLRLEVRDPRVYLRDDHVLTIINLEQVDVVRR